MPKWIVKLAWALFAALVLVVVLIPAVAAQPGVARIIAEYVGRSGSPRITLLDAPCEGAAALAVQRQVLPRYHRDFRGLTSEFTMRDGSGQKTFAGCWLRLDPPVVLESLYVMVFEDNDTLVIAVREFRDQRLPRMRGLHRVD